MAGLNEEQAERYARQIVIPEVGPEGQRKLLRARVLIVGAGGLGSPAAYYLAAAGVGTIGIADSDCVERSNLARQILHSTADVGRPKTASAMERIRALNPEVRVRAHPIRVTAGALLPILADYDFAIDATDNFPSKYDINDACVRARVPFTHAGVIRFEGQMLTILPGESACLRCLLPDPPPAGAAPSPARAGVLGHVPGVMGTLQSLEAVRWILGAGDLLADRLLVFDGLRLRWREIAVRRDPACPACGGPSSRRGAPAGPDPTPL